MPKTLQETRLGDLTKLYISYSFFDRIKKKIGNIIGGIIIGGFTGAIGYFLLETFIVAYVIIGGGFIFALFYPINEPKVYLNEVNREVSPDQENWYRVTDETTFSLNRTFRTHSSGESGSTSYSSRWKLKIHTNGINEELISHKLKEGSIYSPKLYNLPWIGQIGEEIVDRIGGKYVDNTGLDRLVRTQDTANQTLVEILKNQGIKPFTGKIPKEVKSEFDVEITGSNVSITDKHLAGKLPTVFTFILFTVAMSIFYYFDLAIGFFYIDASNIENLFLSGFLLLFTIVFFYAMIFSAYRNELVISYNHVMIQKSKVIGHSHRRSMPISDLKVIQTIAPKRKLGIELIGKSNRFALIGGFNQEEASIIINFIESILVGN